MNCVEFKSFFLELQNQSEQSSSRERALAHVEVCPDCRESWDWSQKIHDAFSHLPEVYPSSESLTKILYYSRTFNKKSTFNLEWARHLMYDLWGWLTQGWNWAPAMVCLLLLTAGIRLTLLSQFSPEASLASSAEGGQPGLQGVFLGTTPEADSKKGFYFDGLSNPLGGNGLVRPVAVDESAPLNQFYHQDVHSQWEVNADALLMRGRRFKSMGRVDLALKDFDEIYHNYPDYSYLSDVLVYRAQCFAFQGHFDQAVESLNLVKEKYPSKKAFVDSMVHQLKKSQSMLLTDSAFQE